MPPPEVPAASDDIDRRLRRMSRRGFVIAGSAGLAGVGAWEWLVTRGEEGGLPWPLRRVLEFNERLATGGFRASRFSPEFPRARARMPRVNGQIGLDPSIDLDVWRLRVVGAADHQAASLILGGSQGSSASGDDDRAEMYRGLEHSRGLGGRALGRPGREDRSGQPEWPADRPTQ